MDGTIADFYSVPFWLDAIAHEETYPYRHAKPLIPFDLLAQLVACGYKLTIISWNAKGAIEGLRVIRIMTQGTCHIKLYEIR